MNVINLLNNIFRRNNVTSEEHDAVIGSIANQLDIAKQDMELLKNETSLKDAAGVWLDEWGSWFSITRNRGESDEDYRGRIIAVISNPHSTIPAIEGAIRKYYAGKDVGVSIYEPYTNIFTHGKSDFSGSDKIQSGTYYRSAVIDIEVTGDKITESLRDSVNLVRASGIKAYYTNRLSLTDDESVVVRIFAEDEPTLKKYLFTELKIEDYSSLVFSTKFGGNTRSGRRELYTGTVIILNLPVVKHETTFKKKAQRESMSMKYQGFSSTSFRSGQILNGEQQRGGFSGYKLSDFDKTNPIPWGEKPIILKPKLLVLEEQKVFHNVIRLNSVPLITKELVISKPSEAVKQTQMHALSYRTINASSEILLGEVWDVSVQDLEHYYKLDEQADFSVIQEPIE